MSMECGKWFYGPWMTRDMKPCRLPAGHEGDHARKAGDTCRHGIPVTDKDAAACAFYENPDHLKAAGPGRRPRDGRP